MNIKAVYRILTGVNLLSTALMILLYFWIFLFKSEEMEFYLYMTLIAALTTGIVFVLGVAFERLFERNQWIGWVLNILLLALNIGAWAFAFMAAAALQGNHLLH